MFFLFDHVQCTRYETSACSGCSCVHNDCDKFNICSDFTQWCKMVPGMTMTVFGDWASLKTQSTFSLSKTVVALVTKSSVLWSIFMLYSASPVTTAAAFLMGNDTVFVYNYHAFSSSVDWLYPCYSMSLVSYLARRTVLVAQSKKRKYMLCGRPLWHIYSSQHLLCACWHT